MPTPSPNSARPSDLSRSVPAAAIRPALAPRPAVVSHPQMDHAGSTIAAHETATGPRPSGGLAPAGVPGLDTSGWQGNVDWRAVYANGGRFAYVKATESTTYRSPSVAQQYDGSAGAGLICGAYHFALPDRSSGTVQADYFVDNGGGWSSDGWGGYTIWQYNDKGTFPGDQDVFNGDYGALRAFAVPGGARG